MGTRYSAVFYADGEIDQAAIQADLQRPVEQVDQQMSTWNPASALMQLNAAPLDQWLSLPDELLWVLTTALRMGEESAGAFEIGVGARVSACGFGPQPAAEHLPACQPSARAALQLHDTAIATSGDYRHWRERDGTVHSHTMDPHSGAPLVSTLTSVSVICTSCMYADAWATALLVLGVARGSQLARTHGLSAIFVLREGDELREITVGL